jgi:hypothetical protein
VALSVIWLLVLVQDEFPNAYRFFTAFLSQGPHNLPAAVRDIPLVMTRALKRARNVRRFDGSPGRVPRHGKRQRPGEAIVYSRAYHCFATTTRPWALTKT